MGVKEEGGELVEEEGITSGEGEMVLLLFSIFSASFPLSEGSFPCQV